MRPEQLLIPTEKGLYCPPGDFYIDPVVPVDRALVTHGHADHARSGHAAVMATDQTLDIMAIRYGDDFTKQGQRADYGEELRIKDVLVRFEPAGHVLGSAQIRVESQGLRITVSGDYKRLPDPTCAAFVPLPCDVFITEATFGLPVFKHPNPKDEISRLLRSLKDNPDRTHMIGAYALGKAQRVIRLLRDCGYDEPIFIHGSLAKLCDYYVSQGIILGTLEPATTELPKRYFAGKIVVAPPSAFAAKWAQRFADPLLGFASGWMQIRARARQRLTELPLVISDHCDWDELTETISDLSPREVWVTHGREEALVRWCELSGRVAKPLNLIGYEDEAE